MSPVRISLMYKTELPELMERFELPQENPCPYKVGQEWTSIDAEKPDGLCTHAWSSLYPYVFALANGASHLFDSWMIDPNSAMVSCPDGFRPVSFLLERMETEE